MDSLFPAANQGNVTRCSPLGCAVICVALIALFYFVFLKDKLSQAGLQIRTGSGLLYQTGSQSGVGSESFSGGHEAPVFWGAAGDKELDDYNQSSARASETFNDFKPAGMVGRLSDAHLASKLGN